MAENVLFFLLLIGTSTFCWSMVFRPSARQKLNEWTCSFYRLDKEGRDTWDAMALVSASAQWSFPCSRLPLSLSLSIDSFAR
jgi:hypothetical protein